MHLVALLDIVDKIHAVHHAPEHRILPIEIGRIVKADEELAVGAVGIGGARHRHGAPAMLFIAELGGQVGLVGTAHAGRPSWQGCDH